MHDGRSQAYMYTTRPGNQEELCNQIRLIETIQVLTDEIFTWFLFQSNPTVCAVWSNIVGRM